MLSELNLIRDFVGIFFGGFVTVIVVYALSKRSENERLKRENEELKMKQTRAVNKPRDVTADKNLIQLARKFKGLREVRIVGINSLGVIHQAREDIKKLLEAGKRVKILLLNPKSDEFIKRIREVECKPDEDFHTHYQRLIAEWNATISILRSILHNIKNKELLEIRVRKEEPTYAFTATVSKKIKECYAWINEYPSTGRGLRGIQFLCEKSEPAQKWTYEKYMSLFETSWNNADPISIDDPKWILELKGNAV